MKTLYLTLLSVSLVLWFPSGLQATEEIHVTVYGDANYQPYSWKEGDDITGIYPAILRRAFARMEGYNIDIVPIPWKRGLRYLEHGRAFALFPPYLRHKARPYISYSVPLLNEQTRVACNKNVFDKPREHWPEDFYGVLIGQNLGFVIGGEKFQQAVLDKKLRVKETKTNKQSLLMVASGRLDCYISSTDAMKFDLEQLKAIPQYSELIKSIVLGPIVFDEQGYLGFTKNNPEMYPYKEDFINQFNRIIIEMQESGEIEAIVREYHSSRQSGLEERPD